MFSQGELLSRPDIHRVSSSTGRASHTKPGKDSNPTERLDPRNGPAACPAHDVAFDAGLLTVNGGLRIHIADSSSGVVWRHPIEIVRGKQAARGRAVRLFLYGT